MFFGFSRKNKNSSRKPSAPPRQWDHLQLSGLLLAVCVGLTGMVGVLLYLFISFDIPDLQALREYRPAATSRIYDSHGKVVDRIYRQNRIVVPLASLPELLPLAFIAAEDARFYEHHGVDGWSVLRALFHNLRSGGRRQGGSTITQQVARALLLSPEKTYTRKIKEAILAYRIDTLLSKKEILHIYLNQIYLGEGAHGVEAASLIYFDKPAQKLDLAEIALLAGLPQAPSRYTPLRHFGRAKKRQAYVLNRMAEEGYITPSAARLAFQKGLLWAPAIDTSVDSRFFLQQVRNYVRREYGQQLLATGGLRIYTTLDRTFQKAAHKAVRTGVAAWKARHLESQRAFEPPQAGLVVLEAETGRLKAVIGSTDFGKSQFDRAIQAKRQPGSAFKPIIYAAAFENGFTPASLLDDAPIRLRGARKGQYWEPKNFNRRFQGPTTLRTGLIHSNNIVTIRLLQELGLDKVMRLARNMGIQSPLKANLSMALGASEVSLLELTAAYAVFANGGKYVRPFLVERIVDRDGRVLEENGPMVKKVLDERIAFQITNLLKGVIEEGTGRQVRSFDLPAAGKTGTTDQNMDAWFVGYTPEIVAGVWLGYDQMVSLGGKETGGRVAAPLWQTFMEEVKPELSGRDFKVPEGITFTLMNTKTGEFADSENSEDICWEAFRKETLLWGRPADIPTGL